jgi:hypothetical protein
MRIPSTTLVSRPLMCGRISRTSPIPTGTIESQFKPTYKSLGGELANELVEIVSDFERRLNGFLAKSEQSESAEEHHKFKLAMGAVLYELGEQFLFPVFRRHKELISEALKGRLL